MICSNTAENKKSSVHHWLFHDVAFSYHAREWRIAHAFVGKCTTSCLSNMKYLNVLIHTVVARRRSEQHVFCPKLTLLSWN